jgi:phosphatidylinositol alpha-1,6-mannosyltransferase
LQKILFLTLKVFSATGGIEKVCKIAGKALFEISEEESGRLDIYSMYDAPNDVNDTYFPATIFKGFGINKVKFAFDSVRKGIQCDAVLLSHVNLLLIGSIIKFLSPKTKLVLYAHGIEIWDALPGWKKKLLHSFNLVVAVSNFTRQKLLQAQQVKPERCVVLGNCLDPFLAKPVDTVKSEVLLQRYGFDKQDFVLLTVSRLTARDRNKGYEKVLQAMQTLKLEVSNLKYLIVGKYDAEEKIWLDGMITKFDLTGSVAISGYIADADMPAHFNLADLYIMPSIKEGFGIIFIEAMFYGLPIIAGNKDGSADALANGTLGILVDPADLQQISDAIKIVVANKSAYVPGMEKVIEAFGYPTYEAGLERILKNVA